MTVKTRKKGRNDSNSGEGGSKNDEAQPNEVDGKDERNENNGDGNRSDDTLNNDIPDDKDRSSLRSSSRSSPRPSNEDETDGNEEASKIKAAKKVFKQHKQSEKHCLER